MNRIIPRAALLAGLLLACQSGTELPAEGTSSGTAQAAPKPSSTASSAASAVGGEPADLVVATWKGGQLTLAEVDAGAKGQLTSMELEFLQNRYNLRRQARESMVVEKILELEAAERGLADVDALVKLEVEDKISPATDAEIESFYNVMQRQLRGAPLESVRDLLAGEVQNQKKQKRFTEWLPELKEKWGVVGEVPFPDLPRLDVSVDDDPAKGADNAPVTIVQFAEYQCGYCGAARETLDKVMDSYPGKVRMVFRDFPLGFHDRAVPAAIAANCAGDQGKYWEMHDLLMDDQRALEDATFQAYARQLKLDLGAFETCKADPAQRAEVEADMAAGQELGVSGTPAFFINGIMLSGAQPFEQFQTIIDKELGS